MKYEVVLIIGFVWVLSFVLPIRVSCSYLWDSFSCLFELTGSDIIYVIVSILGTCIVSWNTSIHSPVRLYRCAQVMRQRGLSCDIDLIVSCGWTEVYKVELQSVVLFKKSKVGEEVFSSLMMLGMSSMEGRAVLFVFVVDFAWNRVADLDKTDVAVENERSRICEIKKNYD